MDFNEIVIVTEIITYSPVNVHGANGNLSNRQTMKVIRIANLTRIATVKTKRMMSLLAKITMYKWRHANNNSDALYEINCFNSVYTR